MQFSLYTSKCKTKVYPIGGFGKKILLENAQLLGESCVGSKSEHYTVIYTISFEASRENAATLTIAKGLISKNSWV
jgi:hypothetical protein